MSAQENYKENLTTQYELVKQNRAYSQVLKCTIQKMSSERSLTQSELVKQKAASLRQHKKPTKKNVGCQLCESRTSMKGLKVDSM